MACQINLFIELFLGWINWINRGMGFRKGFFLSKFEALSNKGILFFSVVHGRAFSTAHKLGTPSWNQAQNTFRETVLRSKTEYNLWLQVYISLPLGGDSIPWNWTIPASKNLAASLITLRNAQTGIQQGELQVHSQEQSSPWLNSPSGHLGRHLPSSSTRGARQDVQSSEEFPTQPAQEEWHSAGKGTTRTHSKPN